MTYNYTYKTPDYANQLRSQVDSIDKVLNRYPIEDKDLEQRLLSVKANVEELIELIKRPLNIGIIGNNNSGKTELVNQIMSMTDGWRFPTCNVDADFRGTFSQNQNAVEAFVTDENNETQYVDFGALCSDNSETLKTAQRVDIKFPADTDIAKTLCKKNVCLTVYHNDNVEQIQNSDIAIIVIKADEYNSYWQLLNYIVDTQKITIPIIVVFTSVDDKTDIAEICNKYQNFENLFFIRTKDNTYNIARHIKYAVSPDNMAIGNTDAAIEKNRIELINHKRNELKQMLQHLKKEVDDYCKKDVSAFQIAKIMNSAEANNCTKQFVTNLENQYGKYIAEIDNMVFQVNTTQSIGQIDSILKELKDKNEFEHHSDNAENFYSEYKDQLKELINRSISAQVVDKKIQEDLNSATENAFMNYSLDIDFENLYKQFNINPLGNDLRKIWHHIKLAIKNIITLLFNPNIGIAVVVGVAVVFGLIWLLGKANKWPFSLILTDDMQASVTKAVIFLVAILSVLILAVIVVATKKNREIEFNKYKTRTINDLNSMKTFFPRGEIEKNIEKSNSRIIAEIHETEQLFTDDKVNVEKQKEMLTDIVINLMDNNI